MASASSVVQCAKHALRRPTDATLVTVMSQTFHLINYSSIKESVHPFAHLEHLTKMEFASSAATLVILASKMLKNAQAASMIKLR